MRAAKTLSLQSPDAIKYESFLKQKFKNLSDFRMPIQHHLVIEDDGHYIGGASLQRHPNLFDDLDVQEHWQGKDIQNCTRILRLWTDKVSLMPFLLYHLRPLIAEDQFIYGIIAISLRFAKQNAELFNQNEHLLKPLHEIDSTSNENQDFTTSDGKRLITTYQHMGAQFLGRPAFNPRDSAVRVIMGKHFREVIEHKFWERYEKP